MTKKKEVSSKYPITDGFMLSNYDTVSKTSRDEFEAIVCHYYSKKFNKQLTEMNLDMVAFDTLSTLVYYYILELRANYTTPAQRFTLDDIEAVSKGIDCFNHQLVKSCMHNAFSLYVKYKKFFNGEIQLDIFNSMRADKDSIGQKPTSQFNFICKALVCEKFFYITNERKLNDSILRSLSFAMSILAVYELDYLCGYIDGPILDIQFTTDQLIPGSVNIPIIKFTYEGFRGIYDFFMKGAAPTNRAYHHYQGKIDNDHYISLIQGNFNNGRYLQASIYIENSDMPSTYKSIWTSTNPKTLCELVAKNSLSNALRIYKRND